MTCPEIEKLLPAYLEGDLDEPARSEVEKHLAGCAACMQELEALKSTLSACHGLDEIEEPVWLKNRIMAHVAAEAEGRGKRGIIAWLFYPLKIKIPLEACAVVMVAVLCFHLYRSAGPEAGLAPPPVIMEQARPQESPAPSAPQPSEKVFTAKHDQPAPYAETIPHHGTMPAAAASGKLDQGGGQAPEAEEAAPPVVMPAPLKKQGQPEEMKDKASSPPLPEPAQRPAMRDFDSAGQQMAREAAPAAKAEAAVEQRAVMSNTLGAKQKMMASVAPLPTVVMNLTVPEVESARREIHRILTEQHAQVIPAHPGHSSETITAAVDAGKVKIIADQLKAVGGLSVQTPLAVETAGTITLVIVMKLAP